MTATSNFAHIERFVRICRHTGYFRVEQQGDAATTLVVGLKETLALGERLAANIKRSWRDNFGGGVYLNAIGGKGLIDLSDEAMAERIRLVSSQHAAGKDALEIGETFRESASSAVELANGIVPVEPDGTHRLTRTLFGSAAMRNENVLKMQRQRKIWWMKVYSIIGNSFGYEFN